jgi:hypothetical protein
MVKRARSYDPFSISAMTDPYPLSGIRRRSLRRIARR